MKKIRIGNTVALSWEIFIHDGDEVLPYDLTGKAISVYLINAFATIKIEDFITEDNVLSFTWEGSEQRFAGVYQLTLVENENTDTMLTFDECEAFELVRCSCSDDEDEDTIEKVELSSKLNMVRVYPIVPVIGPNSNWWVDGVDTGKPSTGMSAYEFAKENGYTGTEEEYAAECAAVPTLNEESRVATAAASEAAGNADRAAGEARRSATVANSASATATNAALAANTAAKAANDAAGSVNGATDNANSAAEAANAAATRAERAIEEFGPAIANKADLENGKIVASQIPDYLLGQVMFGGLIYINNSVIPTVNFDDEYGPFSGQYVIIDIHEYYKYEGVYFIAQEDGIILDIDVKVGDWIVSTGYSWEKIDNTDAVSSVAGLVGNVKASSLAAALADLTDSNSLARKTDLPKKLSELENDIEIGGGGGSYDDSEIKEILSNIVDEEGYLYSNGEKVDMRFTRSLLPVGTSIPASANLNTIEFLKIGKYYCSLNADAKTIKNCPVNVAFSMEVFNPLGTNVDDETTRDYTYRLRVLTQYDTGQQYMQFCRTNGTAGSWIYESWYVTPRVKFALASSKNDGSAAIGATNKGVYIDSTGEIKAMSYTVAKSVPSNAVFTDTNTKVTAVENHYAPAEDESQQIDAPSGEVVTGIKRDAAGHVVGVVSTPQTGGGDGYLGVYGDGYIESQAMEDGTYLTTNVAENLDEVSARGQLADAYDIKTFVEDAVQAGGGDSFWQEDSEGRAFCDRDIQVDGNIIANGTVVTGSIGVPAPEGGYRTGDSGQILKADGNGFVAWDDLSIPTNISQLNDDVGLVDQRFVRENFIEGSEDSLGMKVALIDQFFSSDATLLYAFPDTANGEEDDVILTRGTVKTINGETIYGSGDISISGGSGGVEPYITIEITVEELRTLAEDSEYYTGGREKAAIKQALAEHRSIFVPQSQDESLAGYAVMSGYYEDLLYLQVISEAGELFTIETDCADDTPIYGYQVSRINLWDSDSTLYGTYPVLNSSDSTVSLLANTYTVITAVMSDKVEIILEEYYRTDRTREYVVQFTVSPTADGVQLIVPDRVVWADGVLPAMTPGKTYEISFLSTSGDNSITATFLEF